MRNTLNGAFHSLCPLRISGPTAVFLLFGSAAFAAPLQLQAPNGGENWRRNTSHLIVWSGGGDTAPIESIDLSYSTNSGATWTTIVIGMPDAGSYMWAVPNAPSSNCRVRIVGNYSGGFELDDSAADFTISASPLTLSSPNGGEIWGVGEAHQVTWSGGGDFGTVSSIDLRLSTNSGSTWTDVVLGTPNDGSYSWTVPSSISNVCLVRVIGHYASGTEVDVSDSAFLIVPPPLRVVAPNGGEIWSVGSMREITWSGGSAPVQSIDLDYSTNSGASWTDIVDGTPDDGSFLWLVPNDPSSNCRVRVIGRYTNGSRILLPELPFENPRVRGMRSLTEGTDIDESDADFTIFFDAYPTILSVQDVGNDEGRQARLRWRRPAAAIPVTGYQIYRRQDAYAARAGTATFGGPPRPGFRLDGWDYLGTVPEHGDEIYQYVAPTLCDSSQAGICWSVFLVSAATSDMRFYDSDPDSGYSIDNLIPPVPGNLMVLEQGGAVALDLTWSESAAPDFHYYGVYRSQSPDPPTSPEDPYAVTTVPAFTDTNVTPGEVWYYRVGAFDDVENFSGFSDTVSNVVQTDSPIPPTAPLRFELFQNAPNPSPRATTIRFSLDREEPVRLAIYDVRGVLVRELVSGRLSKGPHEAYWDGRDGEGHMAQAGVYVYRLSAASRQMTKKLVLVL